MKDYLIVGSGLFGSVFAREMTDKGFTCDIIEKREHIGGNCYSEKIEGIEVNKYGGHIFHTNEKSIWDYVNKFTKFRNYYHIVRVNYKDQIYSFPINLGTLNEVWKTKTPQQALAKLESVKILNENPNNLEDWCLNEVGTEIYEMFIKGYTKKQWKKDPKELPTFIIKRLPIRMSYENGYFNDEYQGYPEQGYTKFFEEILKDIPVFLNTDFFSDKEQFLKNYKKIVYTGRIDEFYNYKFGELEYRTLKFINETHEGDYQGCATINYTEESIPFTRIIEHKHFQPYKKFQKTVITKEYPDEWDNSKTPYYPVNSENNNLIYKKYKNLAENEKNIIFGGRLAEYRYYDMHQIIAAALLAVEKQRGTKE